MVSLQSPPPAECGRLVVRRVSFGFNRSGWAWGPMPSIIERSPHLPEERMMQPELPTAASDLERRKQALRAGRSTRPLGAEESRRQEDARWALEAPEVLALYRGEFVVPYRREVVAHGTDAAVVLAEAARMTGRGIEDLPLVGVIDPLLDVPHR
jgi:hypothetical protein